MRSSTSLRAQLADFAKFPRPIGRMMIAAAVMGHLIFSSAACTRKVDLNDTTINDWLQGNVKGLDPIYANDNYSSTVVGNIYEGLYAYHYLKRPYTLIPAIAEAMPIVTDNGTTVTIKLKKGVKFQDNSCFPGGKGREVTAEDFIYSFRRLADPKNLSDGFWIFDGKIKGLNEWANAVKAGKADYSTPIEGFQAPDSHTLVIKLIKPYYQLNYVLAMSFAGVVPREAVEKYGQEFLNNPVGSGPFMLAKPTDWVRNSKITLTRNPNYRPDSYPSEGEEADKAAGLLADAGKQVPFADKLTFTEMAEDTPRWQNLMKGNFDFAKIPNDNYDTAIADKKIAPEIAAKGLYLNIATPAEITYTAFNMKDPLLGKNKELRRALSLSYDSDGELEKFQNGRGVHTKSMIPPGVDAYEPDFKNPLAEFNIDKAKEALAKAGYPDGKGLPELALESLADSKYRQLAQFAIANWAKAGIKVKIVSNTWTQLQEKLKRGQAQIWAIAWGADYPDAQNFLQLFYSKNVSPGPNDSSYSNPEFDALYEKSLTLPPGAERDAVYKKMRDIAVEDAPWIYSLTRQEYRLVHGWVGNLKWNSVNHAFHKYIKIDPKKRAELKAKL